MTIKEDATTTNTTTSNVSQLEAEYDLNFNPPSATTPSATVEEEIIVNATPATSAYASSEITYSASGDILQASTNMTPTPAAVAPSLPGVGIATAGAPKVSKVTQTSADGRTTTTTTTTFIPPPPSSDAPATATVVAGSVVNSTTPNGRAPPPGVPAGGTWGRGKSVGPATLTVCTAISVISCCMIFLPCGLWALLCPCDQRDMYAVHNKAYDEHGRYLGPVQKLNFQPLRPSI
mmetsp:Transcript_2130/g.3264  ORF Transcript_2130/g.3264 Transcript_2130/m.3264 type:complete len:234 (+) Transcript_2130:240-941(+)